MPIISEAQIRAMMPKAGARLNPHLPFIEAALVKGNITTPACIAAFMAQLAHESGEYLFMEEIADGSDYEGRLDLGNTQPGDGMKFKGHGPIQITGRSNHQRCGLALGLDLIAEPRLICEPRFATLSATWFWNHKRLSPLADAGWFKTITRRINGGETHLDRRVRFWDNNREILGLPPIDIAGEIASIRAFQRKQGLIDDGIAGDMTIGALERAATATA